MSLKNFQLNLEEQHHKGKSYLVRCGFMFIQQASVKAQPSIVNKLKLISDSYNGVFSKESLLKFFNTYELKAEIRHRTGLPSSYDKSQRKKYG